MSKLSEIFKILCGNEFSIINCAMFEMTREQSDDLIAMLGFGINDIWCSGPSVAFVVTGCNAFHRLKQLVAGE